MKNKSRILDIVGIPTLLMINKYKKETTRKITSNRNIESQMSIPVESKDLPSHLGNKINIFI